ncbi:MAG: hypothetical protein CME71_02330 [Halobacteriovorax sp.]|nr:hypothetical protein [Halobacteriovorax sp.]
MKLMIAGIALLASTSILAEMPSINWGGDFRYRYEAIDDGASIGHKDHRQRIRARLNAHSEVIDKVHASIQLASGNGAITSTNQTLGDGGSNKALDIDIFSIDWMFAKNANATLGKMKNPLHTVGNSDIVFDTDFTPEGASVGYKTDLYFASLNQFVIANNSTSADVILYAPQAGINLGAGPVKFTIGGSWYNYSSMVNQSVTGSLSSAGNSTAANFFQNGYKVLNGFAEMSGQVSHLSYSVFYDYIKNGEVETGDTGWLAGAKLKCHNWTLSYDYRWVETDATVGFLADGDVAGSLGTGLYGHRTDLGYAINKNVSTNAVYYAHTKMSNKQHYDKYQVNLVFKF